MAPLPSFVAEVVPSLPMRWRGQEFPLWHASRQNGRGCGDGTFTRPRGMRSHWRNRHVDSGRPDTATATQSPRTLMFKLNGSAGFTAHGTVQVDVKVHFYTMTVTLNGVTPNSRHQINIHDGNCATQYVNTNSPPLRVSDPTQMEHSRGCPPGRMPT